MKKSTRIGYARVSTGEQNLDLQRDRTAYFKGGIRGQDNVAPEAVRAQRVAQGLPRSRIDGRNAHTRKKTGRR